MLDSVMAAYTVFGDEFILEFLDVGDPWREARIDCFQVVGCKVGTISLAVNTNQRKRIWLGSQDVEQVPYGVIHLISEVMIQCVEGWLGLIKLTGEMATGGQGSI